MDKILRVFCLEMWQESFDSCYLKKLIRDINHVEINHGCILYHVHHPNLSHSGLQ